MCAACVRVEGRGRYVIPLLHSFCALSSPQDFVNGGFHAYYTRYLLFVYDSPSAPTPPKNTTAPRLQIAARSPSLGSFTTYSWEP